MALKNRNRKRASQTGEQQEEEEEGAYVEVGATIESGVAGKASATDNGAASSGTFAPLAAAVDPAVKAEGAQQAESPPDTCYPHQLSVYRLYNTMVVQGLVACIIVANFLVTIAEKEWDPYKPEMQRYRDTWRACEYTFNSLFAVELVLNMAGSGVGSFFWKNPWNVFDFVVVVVGILTMSGALEGPLENLRMLRFFRVFRLFKRVESLNKIVTALLKAIPGVLNAFLIMLIVMCIYAIFAVEYFSSFGETGFYTTVGKVADADGTLRSRINNVSSITARSMRYGEEYYGTFSRALYTLFQVLTGESWSEAVARPLMFGDEAHNNAFGPALFFTSFILLTQVVLVNVVVAVLLDNFVTEPSAPAAAPAPIQESESVPTSTTADAASAADAAENSAAERAALATQLSTLKEDVAGIKSQMGDVVAMKQQLDAVLGGVKQMHATIKQKAPFLSA